MFLLHQTPNNNTGSHDGKKRGVGSGTYSQKHLKKHLLNIEHVYSLHQKQWIKWRETEKNGREKKNSLNANYEKISK